MMAMDRMPRAIHMSYVKILAPDGPATMAEQQAV
jgi:hypothetical protein